MAQTYTINGVAYSFPDVDDSDWGQNVTDWAGAVSSFLLQRSGGTFTLSAEVDFGSSYGLLVKDLSSKTANPATAGFLQLAKTDVISWRNNANDGNLNLEKGTDDLLQFNSIDLVNLSATQTLTNKTLTTPVISSISNTGTLTLPTSTDTLVGRDTTDTLTNKTMTSPVINTGISGTAIDNNTSLGSSATKVPTQNAVKSYVDAQVTASDLDFSGDTGGAQAVDLDSESLTIEGSTGIDTVSSDADGSSPKISIAIDSSVTTNSGTQTLTNKTLTSPKVNEDVVMTTTSTYLNRMDATSSVQTQLNAKQATITGAATTIASSDLTASKVVQSNGSGKIEASTVTTTTLGYLDATSSVQTQLNAKQATVTGAATTITGSDLTASKVLQSNGSGKVEASTVTTTTLGYLDATSSVQTQLDAKAPISQPEFTSYVDFDSISAPGAPSDSGDVRLYANSSKLYFQGQGDGSPTEVGSGGGGGAGDADTIQLKTAEASDGTGSAPWYTGNDLVPGGGGTIGGTWELSTSNPLINTNDATKVFHYSNGTSNRKGDYFEIELDVPNYAKGHNLVVQLFYRTVGAEDTDFLFFARDRTADYSTQANGAQGATNNVVVDSSTGFAVGDRICFEDSSNARHFRYVTAVPDSTHVTFSGAAAAFADDAAVVTKFFTDELDYITAENNTTNYEGKIRKWAFQINDTTTKIRVGFLYDNSATSTNELFFDQILLSSSQFLQTSSKGLAEWVQMSKPGNSGSILGRGSTNTAIPYGRDEDYNTISKCGTFVNSDTLGISFTATVKCIASMSMSLGGSASQWGGISLNSNQLTTAIESITDAHRIASEYESVTNAPLNVSARVPMNPGDVLRPHLDNYFSVPDYDYNFDFNLTVEPEVNNVVLLNSQDEIFTDWVDFDPVWSQDGGSAGPVAPTSYVHKQLRWRRVGSNMEIDGYFNYDNAGTNGSSTYTLALPSGYTIAPGELYLNLSKNSSQFVGEGLFNNSTTMNIPCQVRAYSESYLFFTYGSSNVYVDGGVGFAAGNWRLSFRASVPIAGWTSTFNPVLSMPLVKIGNLYEQIRVSNWTGGAGHSVQSSDGVSQNTSGSVVSLTNSASGFYVTALQRCIVTMNVTWRKNDVAAYLAIVGGSVTFDKTKDYDDSHWDNYRVSAVEQEQGYLRTLSGDLVLEPGDVMGLISSNETGPFDSDYLGGCTVTAKKIIDNVDMAHIIKPAVCIVKNVQAYNQGGGDADPGSWGAIPLNTIEGESWFLSFNSINYEITLEPGMYKYAASAPFYDTNRTQLMLRNQTDSLVHAPGIPTYTTSYEGVGFNTVQLETTFTITKSTAFSLKYRVETEQDVNGLGYPHGIDSGVDSVYGLVKIEKLK